MSARVPSVHAMTLLQQSATGGAFTNSGARTAGGLENIGTATSNTFTAVEIIQIQETVSAPAGGGPGGSSAPPYDGGESAAVPYIKVKSITIPSSYQGESLSFSHPSSSSHNPTNFVLAPDIKLSCTVVNSVVAGVGTATTTSAITGPVREMDDWVIPWTPETSVPKFNGSDFATTRSAGYGRENGIFTVTIELEYGLIAFSSFKQTKTWTISIINNADNDREVYIAAYREAYGSLTKVPELSERVA